MEERHRDRNWTMQVTALYDYEPEQSDELGFEEGDVLRVLRVQDDGWWSGFNVENPDVVGLFPSNYVQAQRTVAPVPNNRTVADTVTSPRPPANSRQRIQQQLQQERAHDTPELEDESEDDDKVHELRGEYRGHIGTVLQLRRNLEEAERASEAARDARRQAEREKLRHRKSWRERELDEEELNQGKLLRGKQLVQQQEIPLEDGEDTEDEGESAYPQRQGYMHESDGQQAEEIDADKIPGDDEESDVQTDVAQEQAVKTANVENAAATLIAKAYRRHAAIVQSVREQEREVEQQKLSEVAAVCIQRWAAHAYSRQCKRRQREQEQSTSHRRWELENEAATDIQTWIRLRWASFWRRRVQLERTKRSATEAQQARQCQELPRSEQDQAELEGTRQQEAEREEKLRQLATEEKKQQQHKREAKEEEKRCQVLQQKLDDEDQQRRQLQLQLKAVEEEVQRRFLQAEVHDEKEVGLAVPSYSAHLSPDKPRRKVMKKEAVELIKTLVQQQLSETLHDHDAKMDELQRMVVRLQTVVRKQTAMLQNSTDEFVNLQVTQRVSLPPKNNDAVSRSFLPTIGGQSSAPRQPAAPSGLRAPRPVVLSKLPGLVSSKGATSNQLKATR